MTWNVHITEHTFEMLRDLPEDTRGAIFALFRNLERDPYDDTIVKPHGLPDGRRFDAAFSHGIVVFDVDPDTGRITPWSVTAV